MEFVSAGFVVTSNLVTNCLHGFDRKPNRFTTSDCKLKPSPNNSSNNSNIPKTNTINSHAGDWYAPQTFGNRVVKINAASLHIS
jgi:hypothetical protein